MSRVLKYVWDHILTAACCLAMLVGLFGCASAPIQTEITVGPVACNNIGIMIHCRGPETALWTLDGTYATFGPDFSYYSPKQWTRLEVTTLGWGTEIWVRRNGGDVEFSTKGPK